MSTYIIYLQVCMAGCMHAWMYVNVKRLLRRTPNFPNHLPLDSKNPKFFGYINIGCYLLLRFLNTKFTPQQLFLPEVHMFVLLTQHQQLSHELGWATKLHCYHLENQRYYAMTFNAIQLPLGESALKCNDI